MRYVGTTAILQLHPKALAWKTAKNLALIQAKVARHSSDDTIGLVDLCTILRVQHLRCGVYGIQAEVFTLFDVFQNCSFLC